MTEHAHHDSLIESLTKEYQDIFANSEQGVYIYLDDSHKICNKKFATMLGYSSEDEWAKIDGSFPDVFVTEASQDALISSFQDAMEKNISSSSKIIWKKKDGDTLSTTVLLAPISHEGHLFALHFVSAN